MKRKISMALLASLTLVMSQACSKDKKDEGKKGDSTEKSGAAKVTDKGGDAPGGKAAGDTAPAADSNFLAHLPVDTEVVVGVSLGNLTQSNLWKQYEGMIMSSMTKEFAEFQEACGFNPITTVKGVYMGINTNNSEEPVVVVDGIKRDVLGKCIEAMAKKDGEEVTVTEDGKLTVVKSSEEDNNVTIGWINDSMMVMTPKKSDAAWINERIEGKNSISGNKSFMAVADAAQQSKPLWFAAKFAEGSEGAKGIQEASMGMAAPMGLYGSLGFDTGLDIDLGIRFKTGEEATKLVEMAKPQISGIKPMLGEAGAIVDKLDLKAVGNDMQVKLSLTEADLQTLQKAAGPMMGAMGGM